MNSLLVDEPIAYFIIFLRSYQGVSFVNIHEEHSYQYPMLF